jgi:formamidopyrimidine-DNA glycosylase
MPVSADMLERYVAGAKVAALRRRAKVLLVDLDSGYTLMVHLKMTGQLVFVGADGTRLAGGHPTESMAHALPDRSTRVIFEFVSGDRLYFNDQRKFGWVKLVPTAEVEQDALVARLGPEVSAPEFSVDYLASVLRRRKAHR